MVQFVRWAGLMAGVVAVTGLAVGCGGDGDGSKLGGGSFQGISSAIESPSGTVDESTVTDIGEEFEKVANSAVSGRRADMQVGQTGTQTQSCPAGGSFTVSASGNQSSGSATVDYANCCYVEDCCASGNADWYYSQGGEASYTMCGSYQLDTSCEGQQASLDFSGCLGSSGEWIYVVEVNGETYAVSGYYSDGSGTLEITGENGTWTCTYTDGAGSCTGSDGDFDF